MPSCFGKYLAMSTQPTPYERACLIPKEAIVGAPTYCCEICGRYAREVENGNWLVRQNIGETPSRWQCADRKLCRQNTPTQPRHE